MHQQTFIHKGQSISRWNLELTETMLIWEHFFILSFSFLGSEVRWNKSRRCAVTASIDQWSPNADPAIDIATALAMQV